MYNVVGNTALTATVQRKKRHNHQKIPLSNPPPTLHRLLSTTTKGRERSLIFISYRNRSRQQSVNHTDKTTTSNSSAHGTRTTTDIESQLAGRFYFTVQMPQHDYMTNQCMDSVVATAGGQGHGRPWGKVGFTG